MGRRYKLLVLIALTCILVYIGVIAFNTQVSYAATLEQLKAAFIVNFVKLTKWPNDVTKFEIGVYKNKAFADLLGRILTGKKIQGKEVEVLASEDASQFANCHVIFVSKSATGELGEVFVKVNALAGPAKLTIGETDDGSFINSGGMINFVEQGAKIKFKVNLIPAKAKKLTISAKLLKLAIDVKK